MPYRTVTEATKAIKAALKKPLTKEAATELWAKLTNVNLKNLGGLLYELFLAQPVTLPNGAVHYVLGYLRDSGLGFEKVINYMNLEMLVRSHGGYNIPVALLAPMLVKNPETLRWVEHDPTLYSEGLRADLLQHCKGAMTRSGIQKLCLGAPDFWASCRAELLSLLTSKITVENIQDTFEDGASLFTVEERVNLLMGVLEKIPSSEKSSYLPRLYKLAKNHLPLEAQVAFVKVLTAKVEELLKAEATQDPVTAFLAGEMDWREMAFAKNSPDEYRKYKSGQDAHFMGYGPPGWGMMLRRRPWVG